MAVIARRTFGGIRDEVILRLGNITATGFSARVEHWVWEAYQDLCLLYHHHELDEVDTTKTLSTSNNEVAVPATAHVVVGVRVKQPTTNVVLGHLRYYNATALFADYKATTPARPTRFTRFKASLYVDTKPDQAYPLEIYHYRKPTAPDFSSGSAETGVDCDGHIIEWALAKAWPAIARPDLGNVQRELLGDWLRRQVRADLLSEELPGHGERQRSTDVSGGRAQA